jgi:MSHA biogenesis protein MshQ
LQYWVGATQGWQNNVADVCTAIQASDFAFAFTGTGNGLAACETAMTIGGAAPNYVATLAKPGAGNAGWSDITLNLGSAAAGNQCAAVGAAGAAATTVNAPWLQFDWTGSVGNPTARATFGRYKTPLIYRRENY